MRISRRASGAAAVAVGLAVTLAACGSSSSSGSKSPSSSSSGSSAAPTNETYNKGASGGSKGGTLRVLGEGDISSYDTSGAYDTNSYALDRLYARQLYSYNASNDESQRVAVQPDIADGQPTISSDGKTYTIKLKQGVKWDYGSGRQVTAADAVRGLKMLCNPVDPFGSQAYYTETIVGEQAFCDGFAKVNTASAAAIKAYAEGTPVAGLKAVDDATLQITLTKPASDFLHFLALPASSPAPIESLSYIPDSPEFRAHVPSDGPYVISSYSSKKSVELVRNPVWDASTDTLRKAYVDKVDVTYGGTPESILQQIQGGSADTTMGDDPIPTASIPGLLAQNSTGIHINPTGGTNPYIVFNLVGGSSAIQNVKVRQAINYAVDKSAVSQVLGGPKIFPVINQIFSSAVVGAGYKVQDTYPSPNNAGDVAKAKELLKEAGFPNGVSIKFSYRTEGNGPKIAATLQSSLKAAGINLVLKGVPNEDYYNNYLQKTSIAKSGAWDMAEPGWGPDWEGASERSYFTPLLDGRSYSDGSTNFGDYNSAAANDLADQALASTNPTQAADLWNQFDAAVMKDAPWVPLVEQNQVNFVGSRVKNYQYFFFANNSDLANLAVQ
jgi:ABC-type transport system substrate-binding protein